MLVCVCVLGEITIATDILYLILCAETKTGHMGDPPTASLRGPRSLSKTSQICHIFILLRSVAPSALGAAAHLGV